ncbi:MAG: hypothetical protein ACK47B_02225 [Armatimonadota bacterium]
MSPRRRKLGRVFAAAALALVALVPLAQSARAQGGGNNPDWWDDSFPPLVNPYVVLFMYHSGDDISRFQLWTNQGNLEDERDDLAFAVDNDNNLVWPWGSMVLNGLRPNQRIGNSGEERMYANHLTLHVQDPASANGFTDYQFPEDGDQVYFPPVIPLPPIEGNAPGFWTPYTFPSGGPSASGINLEVNQIVQFARDMVRVEVAVRNLGSSRRVGARLIIAPYTDNAGGRRSNPNPLPSTSISDSSVFIPDTRQRIRFETELRGAQIPNDYLVLDLRDDPIFVAKGILRGNDATTPSKVIFGNMLDIFPWAIANAQYDWPTRPAQRLDISDIGTLMYFEPELISTNQTKSFVTYAGIGVVDHGMSLFYQSKPDGELEGEGYVGGLQTDFGLPVNGGDVHLVSDTVSADVYNLDARPIYNAVAFLNLPTGLELVDPEQSPAQDIGFVNGLENGDGTGNRRAQWEVRPNGIVSGLLELSVDFSNEFGDSARAVRKINVPQGRRYQFDTQYRMLTFPFTFNGGQNSVTSAFNLPRTSFQAFRYNPLINQYETVNEIVPGQSYWVRMNGLPTQFVDLQGATPLQVGTTQNTLTTIRRGWNQIGNPSPYAVRVADLQILSPTGFRSYAEAVRNGDIRPSLYEWDFVRREYKQLGADSILQPGRGVWIYANTERRIRWPQPEGPGVNFNQQ